MKILGIEHFIFAIAGMISSFFGPILFEINIHYPIYLSLFCIGVSLLISLLFYENKLKHKFTFKEHTNQIKRSFKMTFKSNQLVWIMLFTFISSIGFRIFVNITQQPYILEMGFSLKEMAYIFLIGSIIGSIFSLFYSKIHKVLGENKSLFFIISFQTLILFMIGFFTFKINVIFLVLYGVIRGYQGMTMNDHINKHIDSKKRATILSISSFFNNLFAAFVLFFIGFVIDKSSILTGHVLTGIFVTTLGLALLFYKLRSKRL